MRSSTRWPSASWRSTASATRSSASAARVNFDQARAQLDKSRAYTDEVLALFYALADLNQGLIERKEVPTFITANVKNWLEEEAKAIAAGKKD